MPASGRQHTHADKIFHGSLMVLSATIRLMVDSFTFSPLPPTSTSSPASFRARPGQTDQRKTRGGVGD